MYVCVFWESSLDKVVTVEPPIKGTVKKGQPLYKGHGPVSPKIQPPIVLIHFLPLKEDNLSTKDKSVGPKVSFIQRGITKTIIG